MASQRSRREFLKGSALAGIGLLAADQAWALQGQGANDKINFACIGVGGKGESDTADAARFGNIVAICDIDDNTLAKAAMKYPTAKVYNDYRKMFDEMAKSIDAVTVSTPDHTHYPASISAMQLGKHCFTQKPLTHSIWEARRMGQIAREKKVATQMGNQGTSNPGVRRAAAMIRKGVVGTVKHVHVWTNRPIWPQGLARPASTPAPSNVHWDLWLGSAPERPYAPGYHTFAWRGWWDFGTGALGDMACHTLNMPFMALDLRYPTSVVAQTSGHNKDSYPAWSQIDFEFPANSTRPALKLTWYDGGKHPPSELVEGKKFSDSGCIVEGEKGRIYSPNDYGAEFVIIGGPEEIEVDYVRSPGHFEEYVRAIKTGEPAMSNFPGYAGPLTETILLGNLAVWAEGKKIEWDARKLEATNAPEVAHIVKPSYREGFSF